MSPEEMITNLVSTLVSSCGSYEERCVKKGTLAKSGTSEFIAKAESGADSGNLIGSFGRKSIIGRTDSTLNFM
jgi:hypothetical protein